MKEKEAEKKPTESTTGESARQRMIERHIKRRQDHTAEEARVEHLMRKYR